MAATPKVRRRTARASRALFCNDWHVPYHDPKALALVFEFALWFKPDEVFLVGDATDFYQVSKYNKDPHRLIELQEDLDATQVLLRDLRKRLPKAKIAYLNGNHEHRMSLYLQGHPEIANLRALRVPELLGLGDLDISHHEYTDPLQWHGLRVEHGDRVSNKSAYTAAKMLDARGVSGLSGHTHRLGTHYRRNCTGTIVWFENGCLCDLSPHYCREPDWQQGFSVGYAIEGDGRFLLEQVPILRNRIFYRGEVWSMAA